MSPYYEKGKKYARVTEIVGAGDCEATAAIEADPKRRKAPRTRHMVTLPGTLTHSKIQQQEQRTMGKPSRGLYLEPEDQKLFSKIFTQHKRMKKKDAKAQTTYKDLMDKVNDCFANYLAFCVDHPHKPLMIEYKMLSNKYRCGGTVDMVAFFWMKGYTIRATPDEKGLPEKVYFKLCDHGDNCRSCQREEVVCVLDWKTSVKKQAGHREQMSAYYCMLEEKGVFDKYRKQGRYICWETWSVLLGPHTLKRTTTPYQLHLYDPNIADFLVSREVNESPEYISRNLKGKIGLKGRCMFCSYLLSCPDRLLWNLEGEIEFQTSLTRQELAFLNLSLMEKKTSDLQPLVRKINLHLAHARAVEEEIEANMEEVLKEFEHKLDIQIAQRSV